MKDGARRDVDGVSAVVPNGHHQPQGGQRWHRGSGGATVALPWRPASDRCRNGCGSDAMTRRYGGASGVTSGRTVVENLPHRDGAPWLRRFCEAMFWPVGRFRRFCGTGVANLAMPPGCPSVLDVLSGVGNLPRPFFAPHKSEKPDQMDCQTLPANVKSDHPAGLAWCRRPTGRTGQNRPQGRAEGSAAPWWRVGRTPRRRGGPTSRAHR